MICWDELLTLQQANIAGLMTDAALGKATWGNEQTKATHKVRDPTNVDYNPTRWP